DRGGHLTGGRINDGDILGRTVRRRGPLAVARHGHTTRPLPQILQCRDDRVALPVDHRHRSSPSQWIQTSPLGAKPTPTGPPFTVMIFVIASVFVSITSTRLSSRIG